jgi:hypothetical protein
MPSALRLLTSVAVCLASCKSGTSGEGATISGSKASADYPYIPSGVYSIGCNRTLPCFEENGARTVSTPGLWIDKFKTTRAEYAACSDAGRCPATYKSTVDTGTHILTASLDEARAFCAWRGGRLPGGDEWEIAARGTDQRLYPWGNRFDEARLPSPRVMHAGPDLDIVYYVRTDDPASVSPFGVSEMSGHPDEFALGAQDAQLRGAARSETEAEPIDYAAVRRVTAPPGTVAAFRCVYDQKPH